MPKKLTLLVVDDDDFNREWVTPLAESYLKRYGTTEGYDTKPEVHEAETPEKGLELLEQREYDAVILDINFKVGDTRNREGLDKFLVPCRTSGNKVPVICWSSDSSWEQISRELGADGFLDKCVDDFHPYFARVLNEVLTRARE